MKKVRKAIIPAAGYGTRFLPATKAIPKPMLPVLDTPAIQYIVEEAASAGIEEIIIVTSKNSTLINDHFGEYKELEDRLKLDGKKELYEIAMKTRTLANVKFVVQETLNGLAGAILCAEKFIGDEPFALLLGDEMIYTAKGDVPCIKTLADIYEETDTSAIATIKVSDADVSKYGNIGIKKDGKVKDVCKITEKPSNETKLSNYAIIGRYVLSGEIFSLLKDLKPHGSEIYLTDALNLLAENGKLKAAEFDGIRYDTGDKFGYVKANIEYALRKEETRELTKALIKELAEKL